MQIVDDGAAAKIEEILAYVAIAGTSALPSPNMGQNMFHRHSFTQLGHALAGFVDASAIR
jgi:hypothetical protein